jgi:lipopolysaccharide transport system permease protein
MEDLSTDSSTEIVIDAGTRRSLATDLAEVWRARELIWMLALQRIAVRYKQAGLGKLWAPLQPIITTIVFSLVFGVLAQIPSEGTIPYPVFVFSGLLMWQYLTRSLLDGTDSLVFNASMISKVYFPRLILPVISTLSQSIDFAIAFSVLLCVLLLYGMLPSWHVIFVPVIVLIAASLAIGISLVLAPLNAVYRDIGLALPFAVQMAMYLTPVIYPVAFIPKEYAWIYLINPAATLLGAMRWAVVGGEMPSLTAWAILFGYIAVFLVVGRIVFRQLEGTLVDRI